MSEVTVEWLEEVQSDVARELRQGDDKDELGITGLEPIIIAMAAKIVVSVVSGFLGKAAWDKYSHLKGRKSQEALAHLVDEARSPETPLPKEVVQEQVVKYAQEAGLAPDKAAPIVAEVITRTWTRYE
jgi:hypothetical protein